MKKFLLVLLILIVASIVVSPFFLPVAQVKCVSQYGACSEEILSELVEFSGNRWIRAKDGLEKKLSGQENIKAYQVNYEFPQKLAVYIFERKPEIAVLRKNDDKYMLVDRQGHVLGQSQDSPLPVLKIKEAGHSQEELQFTSHLFYEIFSAWGLTQADLERDSIRFQNGSQIVIFPLEGDLDELLGAYTLVLSWLKSENKDFTIDSNSVFEIDFRFHNPVIRI